MIDVFLLLGSNLGDRKAYLQKAIDLIETELGIVVQKSSVFETEAWGKTDEPNYLNQVVQVNTALSAQQVLEKILQIEIRMGRVREEKWGSRIIDIDILFYGQDIINEPGLIVPHPELHNRKFTLEPLNELAPNMQHPVLKKSIFQLKNELKDNLIVKKL
ncbi:MAG: 2-amino-4-hydroxy-6-hydroxymethyldihydropteridine diphosphokinase [Bacteroidetes bacterium]|jgi:2-amino-4-hydroxy-6-hydroxymethyldihydropteridine diphosphokinase|nr:2-amino-4-hydroxy-6-hydroxymethyldihydropteridine diphosphokinase [Bacteroidota bacterium]